MTTPGGVPNLPQGALTLDTLASKTQDTSSSAMKSRAAERFPSIFNTSTGLDPALDFTPFGILTSLWAGFNSFVANADPNDIQGPEDLPHLLVSFIESLPFVGEFVGLLDAILGTYTGDDEALLTVQEIFAPIRDLMALDPVSFLNDLSSGWQSAIDAIINGFTGSTFEGQDPASLQGVVAAAQQQLDAALQMAGGAWQFAQDAFSSVAQIVQQVDTLPIFSWWGEALDAFMFWTLGWFTNTTTTQQATVSNTAAIGAIWAHLNPATASIVYDFDPAISLSADYIGPDGTDSGYAAWTAPTGESLPTVQSTRGVGWDSLRTVGVFSGNPMGAVGDGGLITDRHHVEMTVKDIGTYGTVGFFLCGNLVSGALGQHVMVELNRQAWGDSLAIATYTGVGAGRTQRLVANTGNGMNYIHVGDVIAIEYDDDGHFSMFINGVLTRPDAGPNYWDDSGATITHGTGYRESGVIVNVTNSAGAPGAVMGNFVAYDF